MQGQHMPISISGETLVTWLPAHVKLMTPTNRFAASAKPKPGIEVQQNLTNNCQHFDAC